MGANASSRDRMIVGAIDLIRERGVAGVTVDAIVSRSEAPRGSVYYHFPDGRTQIVREAMRSANDAISRIIETDLATDTSSKEALAQAAAFWKQLLEQSDFQAGCPFVAATVDGFTSDPALREVVEEHCKMWQEGMAQLLTREGHDRRAARRKARLAMSAFDGAVLLCRSSRSLKPLDDVIEELRLALS